MKQEETMKSIERQLDKLVERALNNGIKLDWEQCAVLTGERCNGCGRYIARLVRSPRKLS